MDFLKDILSLTERALESAVHFSTLLTVLVAANLFIATSLDNPFQRFRYQRKHLLMFLPFLLTVAILAWGVLMRHDSERMAPAWPQYVISGLLALHLPAAGCFLLRMKRIRWFALSISLFQIWLSAFAAVAATISVTGDRF
jgi:cytochrome bd-type quinol oxidase subunit 2